MTEICNRDWADNKVNRIMRGDLHRIIAKVWREVWL